MAARRTLGGRESVSPAGASSPASRLATTSGSIEPRGELLEREAFERDSRTTSRRGARRRCSTRTRPRASSSRTLRRASRSGARAACRSSPRRSWCRRRRPPRRKIPRDASAVAAVTTVSATSMRARSACEGNASSTGRFPPMSTVVPRLAIGPSVPGFSVSAERAGAGVVDAQRRRRRAPARSASW